MSYHKTTLEPDDYYFNKEGYRVFTEKYHLKRGYCCQSGCKHCPYGFDSKTQRIIPQKQNQMSIKEAYNQWADIYDSNENRTRDLDVKATQSVLSKIPFDKVLELGCGTGKNTYWLAQKSTTIHAVDFSEGMLKKAQKKIKDNHVKFVQTDIKKSWKFAKIPYDLVTCNLVLEHIENLDNIFQKAYEVLLKDGYLFVCELHPIKQYLGTKARYESGDEVKELEVYTHHASDFLEAAEKQGFRLLKLQEWFDKDTTENPPRLLSMLFQK